jgi:hypothetical protein
MGPQFVLYVGTKVSSGRIARSQETELFVDHFLELLQLKTSPSLSHDFTWDGKMCVRLSEAVFCAHKLLSGWPPSGCVVTILLLYPSLPKNIKSPMTGHV